MQSIYTLNYINNNLNNSTPHVYGNAGINNVPVSETNDSLIQDDYNRIIEKALKYQSLADSLRRLANNKRSQLSDTKDLNRRAVLADEISGLDAKANEYQKIADENYDSATNFNDRGKVKADTLEGSIRLVKEINGIKVYQYILSDYKEESEYSLILAQDNKLSMANIDKSKESATNEFKILKVSPYNDLNPIPSNVKLPDGLIFRIQLGVFSKPVPNNTFGGFSPVSYEEIKGKIKYYTGIFYSSESANEALINVRDYGFSDSFLVSFYNSKKISIEKAKEIEYSQIKL